jgi:hypothetical protein
MNNLICFIIVFDEIKALKFKIRTKQILKIIWDKFVG